MSESIKWRGHEIPRDVNGWTLSAPGFAVTVYEPTDSHPGEFGALVQIAGGPAGYGEHADAIAALNIAGKELADFFSEMRGHIKQLLGEES